MKKILTIKKTITIIAICFGMCTLILINGCVESKAVAAKSGAQLWAENCQRCHNTPSPTSFSSEQWKTIGMHMQTRAMITNNEKNKIVEFLQSTSHN